MKFVPFDEIEGCGMLTYPRYDDDRGFFQELFNRQIIANEKIPFPWSWAQENVSASYAGVLRGFHIQGNKPQGKLVTCLMGRIMDVCLDLRPNSKSFMKMTRVFLDSTNPQSFYLPEGTAHAFIALTDCLVHYKCTTPYDKHSDGGVNAITPELAMVWPPGEWQRSDKDRALPNLVDYLNSLK